MLTADFEYSLPEDLSAQTPIEPRDSSRLLDTRDLSDRSFTDLPSILRCGDLLVVNNTRVRAARLLGAKEGTGGRVEILLLRRLDEGRWEALVRPARRLGTGVTARFGDIRGTFMSDPVEGKAVVALEAPVVVEQIYRSFADIRRDELARRTPPSMLRPERRPPRRPLETAPTTAPWRARSSFRVRRRWSRSRSLLVMLLPIWRRMWR